MPTGITISLKGINLHGELFDTTCEKTIADARPIEVKPDEWSDESYFTIPIEVSLDETSTKKIKIGDIVYWPPGKALAIFFGPTPLSSGPNPVPSSEVNLLGRITDDATLLKKAKGADRIRIYKT